MLPDFTTLRLILGIAINLPSFSLVKKGGNGVGVCMRPILMSVAKCASTENMHNLRFRASKICMVARRRNLCLLRYNFCVAMAVIMSVIMSGRMSGYLLVQHVFSF